MSFCLLFQVWSSRSRLCCTELWVAAFISVRWSCALCCCLTFQVKVRIRAAFRSRSDPSENVTVPQGEPAHLDHPRPTNVQSSCCCVRQLTSDPRLVTGSVISLPNDKPNHCLVLPATCALQRSNTRRPCCTQRTPSTCGDSRLSRSDELHRNLTRNV